MDSITIKDYRDYTLTLGHILDTNSYCMFRNINTDLGYYA